MKFLKNAWSKFTLNHIVGYIDNLGLVLYFGIYILSITRTFIFIPILIILADVENALTCFIAKSNIVERLFPDPAEAVWRKTPMRVPKSYTSLHTNHLSTIQVPATTYHLNAITSGGVIVKAPPSPLLTEEALGQACFTHIHNTRSSNEGIHKFMGDNMKIKWGHILSTLNSKKLSGTPHPVLYLENAFNNEKHVLAWVLSSRSYCGDKALSYYGICPSRNTFALNNTTAEQYVCNPIILNMKENFIETGLPTKLADTAPIWLYDQNILYPRDTIYLLLKYYDLRLIKGINGEWGSFKDLSVGGRLNRDLTDIIQLYREEHEAMNGDVLPRLTGGNEKFFIDAQTFITTLPTNPNKADKLLFVSETGTFTTSEENVLRDLVDTYQSPTNPFFREPLKALLRDEYKL